jgi:hypothetical protein
VKDPRGYHIIISYKGEDQVNNGTHYTVHPMRQDETRATRLRSTGASQATHNV